VVLGYRAVIVELRSRGVAVVGWMDCGGCKVRCALCVVRGIRHLAGMIGADVRSIAFSSYQGKSWR